MTDIVYTVPDKSRVRFQVAVMIAVIVVGSFLGAYLVASGALPDQYNLTLGEDVPGIFTENDDFKVTVFATEIASPRFMAEHPETGAIFVSERGGGRVLALRDTDDDRIADETVEIVTGLATPTGLAYHDGFLYIAEAGQVIRVAVDENLGVGEIEVLIDNLPAGRNTSEDSLMANSHSLLIHNDELYISVEASCAACEERDSRRASVLVFNLDGSNERTFVSGAYNALGLAVNPVTGDIWAGVQGRPQLEGDAPEAIYRLSSGDNLGWPYCHAGRIPDPDLDGNCEGIAQPLTTVIPQSNITGMAFYTHSDAPEEYQGDLLVALHGGVNGDGEQVGLAVLRFALDPQTGDILPGEPEEFVEGWRLSEEPGDILGRPMGLLLASDGTLYITDDASDAVYQLTRANQ